MPTEVGANIKLAGIRPFCNPGIYLVRLFFYFYHLNISYRNLKKSINERGLIIPVRF